MRWLCSSIRYEAGLWRDFSCDSGTQIAEFALSLPLLVLFVVGIFDFSGAITLKQKLTNAAREGARVAAADPASDLSNSGKGAAVPVSVVDAYYVVDNYLLAEKINDCGLSGSTTPTVSALTWTYTSNGSGCPGAGITLTINRGCITQLNGTDFVNTCVTIQYPYKWKFGPVAGVLGGTVTGPTSITTTAVAFNEN
jgi:Flp pilus assembly protein TadG